MVTLNLHTLLALGSLLTAPRLTSAFSPLYSTTLNAHARPTQHVCPEDLAPSLRDNYTISPLGEVVIPNPTLTVPRQNHSHHS
jgi:hypothetical protein